MAKRKRKKGAYKAWREANPEKYKRRLEKAQEYRKAHREEVASYQKAWRASNADKCKAHNTKSQQTRYSAIKQLKNIKATYGCMNPDCPCSDKLPPCCYDFHHLHDKHFGISGSTISLHRIIKEINKCTVLCAVCHRLEANGLLDASNFPKCRVDENGQPL